MRKTLVSLTLLLFCIAALPLFLSTPVAKMFIFEPILRQKFGSKATIDSLKLSWLGTQQFEGLQTGKVQAKSFTVNTSLIDLALGLGTKYRAQFEGVNTLNGSLERDGDKLKISLGKNGSAVIDLNDWAKSEGAFSFSNLLVNLLTPFLPCSNISIEEFVGRQVNLDVKMQSEELSLKIESPMVKGGASIDLKDGQRFSEDSTLIYYAEKLPNSPFSRPIVFSFNKGEKLIAHVKTDSFNFEGLLLRNFHGEINDQNFKIYAELGSGKVTLQGKYDLPAETLNVVIDGSNIGLFKEQLGNGLKFKIDATIEGGEAVATLTAESDKIHLPSASILYSENTLSVVDPFTMSWTPKSEELVLKMDKFIWSAPLCLRSQVSYKGALSAKQITLFNETVSNVLLHFDAEKLYEPKFSVVGRLSKYGEELRLKGDGLFKLDSEEYIQDLNVNLESRYLNATLQALEMKDSVAKFTGKASANITDELVSKLRSQNVEYTLTNNALAQLVVNELTVNLNDFSMLSGTGKLLVDELSVGKKGSEKPVSLRKVSTVWEFEGETLSFAGDATTSNSSFASQGDLAASVEIQNFRSRLSLWKSSGEIVATNVPTTLLSIAYSDAPLILGETLSASLNVSAQKENSPGVIKLLLNSDLLHIRADYELLDGVVTQVGEPILIEWQITNDSFQALYCQDSIRVSSPGRIVLQVENFTLPLDSMRDSSFSTVTSLENLELVGTQDSMMISSLRAGMNVSNGMEGTYNVELLGYLKNSPSEAFNFRATGQLSKNAIDIQATAQYLPAVLVGELLCLPKDVVTQVDTLVGRRVDLKVDTTLKELTGPITLSINGTEGNLSLNGDLTNGTMTLREPMTLFVTLTDRLSDSILDELVPFLDSAVSSENPLRFEISPEGFSWDVYGSTYEGLTIGLMTLDLGVVYFKNDQTIGDMLSILKVGAGRDLINVWFTPLYASFQNGIFTAQRMDMLVVDRYPMALWGKVDFPKDKVKMTVGIGGLTLRRAFGLKSVPVDYYLQVALKGTTSDPKLDVKGAATKLAAFIAQLRGGPLGGLMELIGGGLGQKKTPKPTTHPFPWN